MLGGDCSYQPGRRAEHPILIFDAEGKHNDISQKIEYSHYCQTMAREEAVYQEKERVDCHQCDKEPVRRVDQIQRKEPAYYLNKAELPGNYTFDDDLDDGGDTEIDYQRDNVVFQELRRKIIFLHYGGKYTVSGNEEEI